MKKLAFIIAAAFIILSLLLGIYLSRKSTSQQPKTMPQQPLLQTVPRFPDLDTSYRPVHDVSSLQVTAQATLPVYTVEKLADTAGFGRIIAAALGFSGNPTTVSRPRGTYTTWTRDGSYLSVGGDPTEIFYSTDQYQPTGILGDGDDAFLFAAQRIIADLGILPASIQLSAPEIEYVAPQGNDPLRVARDSATEIILSYRYLIENLPVYTGYPEIPSITVTLNADKQLLSLTAHYFPGAQTAGQIQTILPVEQAKQKLLSGQGAVLSVFSREDTNRGNSLDTDQYSFSLNQITSGSLAYYYSAGDTTLAPVYVFFGTAVDRTTKKSLETVTLLSAATQ